MTYMVSFMLPDKDFTQFNLIANLIKLSVFH